MKSKPLVSVITPSFNQGRFIEDLILSIRHQDYPYIEHCVVDGGSTDDTISILAKYGGCVKWISEPDRGFADAVNKGLGMTSGEIVAIQNADDVYFTRDAVSQAVEGFLKNPMAGVVYGDSAIIDEEGRVIERGERKYRGYSLPALLCSEFVFPQGSAFISRKALEAIGGQLDLAVDWCADFDLFVRIALKYDIIYVPSVIAAYRFHRGQRNADPAYARRNPEHRRRVLDKVFAMLDLPPEIKHLRNRAYAGTYLHEAVKLATFGHAKEAIHALRKAIILHPPSLLSVKVRAIPKELLRGYFKACMTEAQLARMRRVKAFLRRRSPGTLVSAKWWE